MENRIVDKGVRFQNYIIDLGIIIVLYVIISIPFWISSFDGTIIIFPITFFLYYFLMELIFKQTLGKKYTQTIIITKNGGEISVSQLLIRTILRFSGYNEFSFLMGNHVGIHDWFSNTRVVGKAK